VVWSFSHLLGDPGLHFPADKETSETEKSDSVHDLPASTAVKDEKCSKLTVSTCTFVY